MAKRPIIVNFNFLIFLTIGGPTFKLYRYIIVKAVMNVLRTFFLKSFMRKLKVVGSLKPGELITSHKPRRD